MESRPPPTICISHFLRTGSDGLWISQSFHCTISPYIRVYDREDFLLLCGIFVPLVVGLFLPQSVLPLVGLEVLERISLCLLSPVRVVDVVFDQLGVCCVQLWVCIFFRLVYSYLVL